MLVDEIKNIIIGDVDVSEETLAKYSNDASLLEIKPSVVVFPKVVDDLKNLVKFASEKRQKGENIYLTPRSGGSDMTGGPLGESIVVEFDRYLNRIKDVSGHTAVVQPGAYWRDYEKATLKRGWIMPSYPASRDI